MMLDPHKDMTAALLQEDEPISFTVRIVERMISGKATSSFSLMVSTSNKHALMPVIVTNTYVRVKIWEAADDVDRLLKGFAAQAKLCEVAPIDHITGLVSRIKGATHRGDRFCGYAEMRPDMRGIYWAEVSMDDGNILLHKNRKAALAAASDVMDWLTNNKVDWTKIPITETILGH